MRNKSFLQQTTSLRYLLLLAVVLLFLFNSCEKEYGNEQEETKELMATVSADKAVAGGDTLTFIDLSLGVENRTWFFPGGEPATSGKPEVGVVFGEEGEIAPTLMIEYFDGTKDSIDFPITIFPVLIADFTPSATRIKVGETITFSDASIGGATSWSWEFESGTPATSTEQNPTVQFDVNKPVSIKLTITRAADESIASVEKQALVQVGPPELLLNGNFETGAVAGWQTWNGSGFPYNGIQAGGANGTATSSYFTYDGSWSFAQIISRDFPNYRVDLENGQNYTLSMYVRAAAPGNTLGTFRLVNHIPSWSGLADQFGPQGYSEYYAVSGTSLPVALTTDWQLVSIVVSIPDDGSPRNNAFPDIIFNGDVTTNIYLDEISLKIVE